jgi:23S rRNA (cytosine1962-C5)-methyltransferase
MNNFLLYEDTQWLVVNKPPFLSTHGAFTEDLALQEWIELHLNKKTFVVSRLDKETSGVILFAKTKESSGMAQKIHEQNESNKEYVFLSAEKKTGTFICQTKLDEKECKTEFEFLDELFFESHLPLATNKVYRYRAKISSGKKHQIRRHAAHLKIPLLGCSEYGGLKWPRLALHCKQLFWPGINQTLGSPLSGSFQKTAVACPYIWAAFNRRVPILTEITNCFRVWHRGEFCKDFSIDLYSNSFLVSVYSPLIKKDVSLIEQICEVFSQGNSYSIQYKNIEKSNSISSEIEKNTELKKNETHYPVYQEHNIKFCVDVQRTSQPGWFLDHRDFRKYVANISLQKRVLNLFSYTSGYGLFAAFANCEVVLNVDSSPKALRESVKNTKLNSFVKADNFKILESDVVSFLLKQNQKKKTAPQNFKPFDIVVCDAPTMGMSQSGRFLVEKEWENLASYISEILSCHGIVFFSNNHQKGSSANYENILQKYFKNVKKYSQPLDFLSAKESTSFDKKNKPEINSFHARFFVCSNS